MIDEENAVDEDYSSDKDQTLNEDYIQTKTRHQRLDFR